MPVQVIHGTRPPQHVVERLMSVLGRCKRRRGTVIWLPSPASPASHVPVEMSEEQLIETLRHGDVPGLDGPDGLDTLLRNAIDLAGCTALIFDSDGARWVIPVEAADLERA